MRSISALELEASRSQFTRVFALTVFSLLGLQVLAWGTKLAGDSVQTFLSLALVVGIVGVVCLYIYFVVSIHRIAMAMNCGLWSIFLALVSFVPLLGLMIGTGLLFASGRAVRAAA